MGYHAFALEENRRYEEAFPLAERAIAMNRRDAWAVHTLAHVLYERGDNGRGIDALPSRIGSSRLSSSTMTLSTPMPINAERRCSVVEMSTLCRIRLVA